MKTTQFRKWDKYKKEFVPLTELPLMSEGVIILETDEFKITQNTEFTAEYKGDSVCLYPDDIVEMTFIDYEGKEIAKEINVVMLEEDNLMTTFAPSPNHRGLTYRDYLYGTRYKNLHMIHYKLLGNIYLNINLLNEDVLCEVCKERVCTENLGIDGEDDFYQFAVCRECFTHYTSDLFTAEDVLEDIKNVNNKKEK